MLNKLKNNKALKIIGNILYALALIIVILILILVLIQRVSDNNMALGGIRIYNVATGSMIPEYQVGDILISKEVEPEEIKIGDDVTYISKENGKLITHRVVNIREENGKYYFITRGISNTADDKEISEDQIYGKVIYKPVILSSINKIIKNMYAFYFLIIVPMAIIIAKMLVNFIINREEARLEKERKNENIENDENDENETEILMKNKIDVEKGETNSENQQKNTSNQGNEQLEEQNTGNNEEKIIQEEKKK